jgi:hypothetical protein
MSPNLENGWRHLQKREIGRKGSYRRWTADTQRRIDFKEEAGAMRGRHRLLWFFLAGLSGLTGCQGGLHHRRSLAGGAEPGLSGSSNVDDAVIDPESITTDPLMVDGSPRRKANWIDRHPLFRKPGEVYDATPGSGLAKGLKATFIGVPMGIGGEVKQIIVGCPPGF